MGLNKILSLLILFTVIFFSSCKKHKYYRVFKGFENEINYPAAYILNGGDNSLSVLNLNSLEITESLYFKGSSFPHHIYLNNNKDLFAVSFVAQDLSAGHSGHSHGSSDLNYMIQVFESKTGKHKVNLFLDQMPHNATFTKDDKELWVSQSGDASEILIYDTKDWKKSGSISVGKGLSEVTFSTNGSKAFAANTEDGTVSIIDVANKSVIKTIATGKSPVGAWPGNNNMMYVDNEDSLSISEISVDQLTITNEIKLGFKPGYAALVNNELWVSSASLGKVVYYQYLNNLWLLKGELITGSDAHAIGYSNYKKLLFVTNQGAANVSVIDPNNYTLIKNISVGNKPNGIAIKD